MLLVAVEFRGQPCTVAVRTTLPAFARVTLTEVPLLGVGMLPTLASEIDQVIALPAGAPFSMYVEEPVQKSEAPEIDKVGFAGGKLAMFAVFVVIAPEFEGSSQLLNLVAFVPLPVQERSNLPYSPM